MGIGVSKFLNTVTHFAVSKFINSIEGARTIAPAFVNFLSVIGENMTANATESVVEYDVQQAITVVEVDITIGNNTQDVNATFGLRKNGATVASTTILTTDNNKVIKMTGLGINYNVGDKISLIYDVTGLGAGSLQASNVTTFYKGALA